MLARAESSDAMIASPASSRPASATGRYTPVVAEAPSLQREAAAHQRRICELMGTIRAVPWLRDPLDAIERTQQSRRKAGKDDTDRTASALLRSRGALGRAAPGSDAAARRLRQLQPPPFLLRDLADTVVAATPAAARTNDGGRDAGTAASIATERILSSAAHLRAVANASARNTFQVLVCRHQLDTYVRQWPNDRAFCHRCGSGPFLLNRDDQQHVDTDDADGGPPACAVCSTTLVPPAATDLRVVRDFEAQVVRRRVATLEGKVAALSALAEALAEGGGPLSAKAKQDVLLLATAVRPATSSAAAATGPPSPPKEAAAAETGGAPREGRRPRAAPRAATPSGGAQGLLRRGRSTDAPSASAGRSRSVGIAAVTRAPSLPTPSRLPARLPSIAGAGAGGGMVVGQRSVLH